MNPARILGLSASRTYKAASDFLHCPNMIDRALTPEGRDYNNTSHDLNGTSRIFGYMWS